MRQADERAGVLASSLATHRRGTVLAVFAAVLALIGAGLLFVNVRLETLADRQVDAQLRTAHFAAVHSLRSWRTAEEPLFARIMSNEGLRDMSAVVAAPGSSLVPSAHRANARLSIDWWLSQFRALGVASEFEVTDLAGRRVVTTAVHTTGTVNPAMKQAAFRRNLLRGDIVFSAPVASMLEYRISNRTPPDNKPVIFAGIPLSRPGALPHAFVMVAFDADTVLAARTQRGLFGRSGHTFLTDRDALVVSNTRLDDILVDKGRLDEWPGRAALRLRATTPGAEELTLPVREVIAGNSGVRLDPYVNMIGEKSVGTWTWLSELGVGVVTEINHDEAYLELLAARRIVNALGLGAIALVLGLGIMVERGHRNTVSHEAQLRSVAMFDSLTGLPNRHAFRFYLERALLQAQRRSVQVALLFIDLDNFKRVNDSLGHDVGDELLVEVSRRLDQCVRGADMMTQDDLHLDGSDDLDHDHAARVARLGGDEFVLMLGDVKDSHGPAVVAQRMLESLARPVEVSGHSLLVSPSIGIAMGPTDGRDVETLVKSADMAMYAAKQAGRNRYVYFSASMSEDASEHLALENRLRLALEAGEIEVHYQPVIDAETGVVASAEALARWTDRELGTVSPSRFVPVAEASGLVRTLGSHVLRRACMDAARWLSVDGHRPPPAVAINIAAEQFLDDGFVAEVRTVLDDTGLPPERVVLEITERVAMASTDDVISVLRKLKAIGVSISMDDFGTGYSSLSYLSRLPIDIIKIDASFVCGLPQDERAAALAATIIAMGRRLGKRLVAEGVETQEQAAFLRAEGTHMLQGWLFANAMPSGRFDQWLGTRKVA